MKSRVKVVGAAAAAAARVSLKANQKSSNDAAGWPQQQSSIAAATTCAGNVEHIYEDVNDQINRQRQALWKEYWAWLESIILLSSTIFLFFYAKTL